MKDRKEDIYDWITVIFIIVIAVILAITRG